MIHIQTLTPLANTLGADSTLGERADFALTGFAVVLVSLALLALLCAGVGALFRLAEQASPAATATSGPALPEPDSGVPQQHVAVIAAAVAAAFDRPHRVVHIRGLTPEDLEWALEGRIMHHTSHNLPHRRQ